MSEPNVVNCGEAGKVEVRFILSEYVERAMDQASYDKLEDGTFSGVVPQCQGVIAFSETLRGCEAELQSVLEDWILTGIKLGHSLPIIDSIDLNCEPTVGAAESL